MAWCKVLLWRTSWHGDQDTVREERHQGGDIPLWVTPALPCFYDQVYFLTFNHWMHLWLNPPMSMSPYDPPKILCMSLWGDILDLNHNSDLRDIAQIWIFLKSMDCPTLLLILFEILYHFFFLLWLVFFCLIWFDFDMPDDMGCKGSKRHYGSRCWLFIILFWSPISLSLSFFDLYCFILFGFILLQIKKKLKMRVRRKMKLIESIRR